LRHSLSEADRAILSEVDGNSSVEPIRQDVIVGIGPERAFNLFTEEMGTWWPVDEYSRAFNEFADQGLRVIRLEFQPRLRGRILEHLSDGRVLPWAEVVDWQPPHRLVMAWVPHSLPEPPTEVVVTFTAQSEGTLVEVEHRGWDRLSPGFREAMYDLYARGWVFTLGRFGAAAAQQPTFRD
jgi:uncharacterized protein YndB with AHSA1/START domain